MNIDDLQAFTAISEMQNFHAAARLLNIAQSTLSARLKRLERALGVTLFERSTRSVALSEAGQRFAKHARLLLAQFQRAQRELQAPILRKLDINGLVMPSFDPISLQRAVAQLRLAQPQYRMSLELATGQDALARVEAGRNDFILLPQWHGKKSALRWECLLRLKEEISVYASPAHPLCAARGLTTQSRIWMQSAVMVMDLWWTKPKAVQTLQARGDALLELPPDAALEWAMAGQGALLSNAGMARRWVERGGLQRVRLRDFPPLFRFLQLMRPQGLESSPALEQFAQALTEHCAFDGLGPAPLTQR